MMWREVKGVFFAQELVVFVVYILLNVVGPIVIIVFNLCRNIDKQTVRG